MDSWERCHEETTRTCEGCGSHVTRDFVRTFGDADGTVARCLNCDTFGRLSSGSAAGVVDAVATDGGST